MKIAIMGIRGVPANYSGFETFAQELGSRLVLRGHDVTVYGRTNYIDRNLREHAGMKLVVLPVVKHKYAETVLHTALSVAHNAIRNRFDIVLMCNSANAIVSWVPRLKGQKVVLNVDGMEWQRKKWNVLGRAWYRLGAFLSTKLPNAMVTDAAVIERFYRERFGVRSTMITYGAQLGRDAPELVVRDLGLQPDNYFLYVSRLEPENNAHLVVDAFSRVRSSRQLALIGNAPYAKDYIRSVKAKVVQDPRIVMPGGVYGDGYRALQSHALAYVHATEVGGTHPALVEAMAAGNCVFAYDTPENSEVVGDAAYLWRTPQQLAQGLERASADTGWAKEMGRQAMKRAARAYSWESVTDRYEALFSAVLEGRKWID